jgi:NhaP-type Na+/H+ or K+/H+ antiporter
MGSGIPAKARGVIAFFGVRGIGSFYYIAYGINNGKFGSSERLWAVTGLVVLISIVVHGISATPALRWIDRAQRRP